MPAGSVLQEGGWSAPVPGSCSSAVAWVLGAGLSPKPSLRTPTRNSNIRRGFRASLPLNPGEETQSVQAQPSSGSKTVCREAVVTVRGPPRRTLGSQPGWSWGVSDCPLHARWPRVLQPRSSELIMCGAACAVWALSSRGAWCTHPSAAWLILRGDQVAFGGRLGLTWAFAAFVATAELTPFGMEQAVRLPRLHPSLPGSCMGRFASTQASLGRRNRKVV